MALLQHLSISEIVSRIGATIVYAWLQGLFLVAIATWMGDRRPQRDGRLVVNPFAQVSVWGVAAGALFAMSWVRPVRYDPASNRFGSWGVVFVVVLGLAATALLIPAADLLRGPALLLPRTGGYALLYGIDQFQLIVAASVLLNLLPIPGLAAGAIWQGVRPEQGKRLERYEALGLAVVIAGLVAGLLPNLGNLLLPFLRIV